MELLISWFKQLGQHSLVVLMSFIGLLVAILLASAVGAEPAKAHGGRTAADGCHKDNKNGGRHCHGGSSARSPAPRARQQVIRPRALPQTFFNAGPAVSFDADVETAQKLLTKLGYDPGVVDGIMGSTTRSAIISFQSDRSLKVTGDVSDLLIDELIDALGD